VTKNLKEMPPVTVEWALGALSRPHATYDSGITGSLDLPWDLSASSFLGFADADLTAGADARCLVNALSNAKRALHCQVDSILYALGLHGETRFLNFPAKLELLTKLGVVTRRALVRVNQSRNVMEHEYAVPRENEVQLFVDVVAFFIEATASYIADAEWEFASGDEFVAIKVIPQEQRMDLRGANGKVSVDAADGMYQDILGAALRLARA
jgi:hypothetical protein